MAVPPLHPTLPHALFRLFAELTGFQVAILHAPPPGLGWDLRKWISGCRARLSRCGHEVEVAQCPTCARSHLTRALRSRRTGHRFRGACGARSFLIPVTERAEPIGVVGLTDEAPRAARASDPGPGGGHDARFGRAVRLLRVLARDTELRSETDAPRAVGLPARDPCGPRCRRAVVMIADRMQREFARPLSVRAIASEVGMNASYLSSTFAQVVGMPFKSYLTALRLRRAQTLLGDPGRRISDIALEVGYASPDRFRAAFRAWTGLSPRGWRDALGVPQERR